MHFAEINFAQLDFGDFNFAEDAIEMVFRGRIAELSILNKQLTQTGEQRTPLQTVQHR